MTLRAKIVALVAGLTASILLGVGLFLSGSWSGWSREALERDLATRAEELAGHVEADDHGRRLELDDEEEVAARDPSRPFRILGPGGAVVATRGELSWPAAERGVVVVRDGRGRAWRVLSLELESAAGHHARERARLVVQVGGLDVTGGALERRFRRGLVVALVVALLAGGAGAAVLAHVSLAPLRRVAAEVDAVGASSLDRRVGTAGLDSELAHVASAFNDLLGRLQVAMERQRSFVSRASHALRTPTATILARAEVALRRDRPASEYRAALADVAEAARESATLVTQLLALARLDEGGGARHEDVPLDPLAQELTRLLRARAEQAGIALEVAVPPELSVTGERAALRELLEALLDNALRYTPRGGRVGIRAEPVAGRGVALVVWDTGPGIPAEERAHVLERFRRGSAADADGAPGSGLGLAIVKAIADAHGAGIELRDRAGGGLEVALTLAGSAPRCDATA